MSPDAITRREFLKSGSAAGLAAGLALHVSAGMAAPPGDRKLRVGWVGTGGRGRHLLGHVLKMDNLEVVAICDITPDNLDKGLEMVEEKTQKRPEASGDTPYAYRKLIARDDIDCVVIATPCYWHTTMYIDCLKEGMSVYGEKPLAITAWELKEIQAVRKQHPDVVLQVGTQWGSNEQFADIIKQVREGAIGDLWDGRFRRYGDWDGFKGWFTERDKSGDWMLEQAVHEFNLMYWLTQTNPAKCTAVGRSGIIPDRDTTSFYTALLEYPDPLKNFVIRYTHTFIEVPDFDEGGWSYKVVGSKGGANLTPPSPYIQLRDKSGDNGGKIEAKGNAGDTYEHLANFFDCVRAGTPDKVNSGLASGVGATTIGLMIRQSVEKKAPVTYEETLADTRKPPLPSA
ncbi:MAG: Myo-inositol 2-dehydrogenase [bacterium]|nr:Myo-inositol 2-dehydrogenase [bacterium]